MVAMTVPPRPPHQSAEEIVNNFCAMKRNSLIQRQRPVSPGMRRRSVVTARRSNDAETTYGSDQLTDDIKTTSMVKLYSHNNYIIV